MTEIVNSVCTNIYETREPPVLTMEIVQDGLLAMYGARRSGPPVRIISYRTWSAAQQQLGRAPDYFEIACFETTGRFHL